MTLAVERDVKPQLWPLGIYVGHEREYCIERNWTDKINKIESMLKMWRERSLTLLGKFLIIKTLALPIVSFVALYCYTPDGIVNAVSNTAKVKKDTLVGNIDQGGLKMIEVGSYFHALKASWVRHLCNANKDDTWACIPNCIFKKLHVLEIIDLLSEPNISRYKSFKHIPTFYKQVIEGYIHGNIKHDAKTDDIDIKEICIWGNKQILNKNNEILYFPKWIESGIITASNLKIIEGKICNSYLFNKLSNKANYLSELFQITYGVRKLLTKNFSLYPTSHIQSVKKV